ncbi:discoidin domain-containing protein [Marinimicrobium sp. ARAG 43.8]|uniref:discoidin domain-containing protein n=1 Tax=Marinimicrobium sp. ARAG 43.8 TaxID=3418719 RepID=UPI003CF171C9
MQIKRLITPAAVWTVCLFASPVFSQSEPSASDFQREVVADGLDLPMEFEIAEDGRVFIASKCGGFYGWDLDVGTPVLTATVPNVRCEFEDGLLSMALDPAFTSNSYVYFQYTAPGSLTRVSRYTVNPDNSLDLASESVLLEWTTGDEAHGHMGGTLLFDNDGNLIITTGDNKAAGGYFQPAAQGTSANTNDLRGKVLRITPTSAGGYTIPSDNLFAGDALHRPEIYAMGFRNPYRMNIDPLTGCLYVGDIGPDANAASAEGPMGMDELNEICAAGNYGWPYIIGLNEPYAGFDPNNLVNNASDNTGATHLPNATSALWTVLHRATMAGPVYRVDESISNEFKLPAFYNGKLIFWDFNSSRFFTLDPASPQTPPVASEMPLNTQGFQGAIDVELDPRTHQLYVLQWGSGCCDKEPYGGGALYRFDYIGNRDEGENLALTGTATATSSTGGNLAQYAIDGDPTTRWESEWSDPQALTVELAEASAISSVAIEWEGAYSSKYVIEGSMDGSTWDILTEETAGSGGSRLHIIETQTAYRFVRITGTERGMGAYGHSILEFAIYGDESEEPAELTEHAYLNMPRELDANFTGVPLLLSQTGAFSDTAALVPSDHLIPYEPNAKLWSDRALKQRWLSLPEDTHIDWHATENWSFPQGTVAVKHFELPLLNGNTFLTQRLETRLLVVQANGRVYGVTYKWREDNSDAELLTAELLEDIIITDADGSTWTQTWAYPSPTQCLECHNPQSSQLLGLNTRQLNQDFLYPGAGSENQLVHWNNLAVFAPSFNNAEVDGFDHMVSIDDASATDEQRVRSYLDANCAHCHGTGNGGSQWDARYNTSLSNMQMVGEETTGIRNYLNDYGIDNAEVVHPGVAADSILYIRDKSVDPSDRMPPVGRALEHPEYIQVLERWINNLGDGGSGGDPVEPVLVSQGAAVTASSVEGDYVGSNATDGNPDTRWSSEASDPQTLTIDLGESYPLHSIRLLWEAAYAEAYTIEGSVDGNNWEVVYEHTGGTGGEEIIEGLSGDYRYLRLTGTARGTIWGYSLWEFEVFSAEATDSGGSGGNELLSLGQPVSASSEEGPYVAESAVDGDPNTRWSSEHTANESIQVDLGASYPLSRIVLNWEAAYATGYVIEVSDNGNDWNVLYSTTNGEGGVEDITVSGNGRYVRLTGTERALPYGYSLWEFSVYGGGEGDTTGPVPAPEQLTPLLVTASSGEGSAANVIDGDPASRWESEHQVDPQYLELDMGDDVYFTRLVLDWEGAFATEYHISVSSDGQNWEPVYTEDNGTGGQDIVSLNGDPGRYLRITGTERALAAYGYSLFEVSVFGLYADAGLPMIDIVSPVAGATLSDAADVSLEVNLSDSSWLSNGGGYRYTLDDETPVTVNTTAPVNLGILSTGAHELSVTLVDSSGAAVSVPRHARFNVVCGNDCPSVLVFSKTSGFRHGSIPAGIAMVERIADEHGFSVTATEDSSVFNAASLAQYSTVVFMNTTGDIFSSAEKTAFQDYIENGGGYVGSHSAADTEHSWAWYTDTLLAGARFIHHGDGIPEATVDIETPAHTLVDHIGLEWVLADEWYFWESNPRGAINVEVLGTLDRSSYASNYPVEDHPVIFTNEVGNGRVFYTAVGHVDANFSDPNMEEMIRKAIEWTSQ